MVDVPVVSAPAVQQPRELPILMHARSIRGLLEKRKTQTRRIIKPQPIADPGRDYANCESGDVVFFGPGPDARHRLHLLHTPRGRNEAATGHLVARHLRCPYGQPGDLLYVRETWGTVRVHELLQHVMGDGPIPDRDEVVYRAGRMVRKSSDAPEGAAVRDWPLSHVDDRMPDTGKWKPSIFMPKVLSRFWLQLTDVRVERVRSISGVDCVAEGCAAGVPGYELAHYGGYKKAKQEFEGLWNDTNGADAWERNDWVWVVTYEQTEAPR